MWSTWSKLQISSTKSQKNSKIQKQKTQNYVVHLNFKHPNIEPWIAVRPACRTGRQIINQKFAIINQKYLKCGVPKVWSTWSKLQISSTKSQKNSKIQKQKTQNYVVHLNYVVILTTVGRRPALPAGGNPLLWRPNSPLSAKSGWYSGDSRPYRTVRSGEPQSYLLRDDDGLCGRGTLSNRKAFLRAFVSSRFIETSNFQTLNF